MLCIFTSLWRVPLYHSRAYICSTLERDVLYCSYKHPYVRNSILHLFPSLCSVKCGTSAKIRLTLYSNKGKFAESERNFTNRQGELHFSEDVSEIRRKGHAFYASLARNDKSANETDRMKALLVEANKAEAYQKWFAPKQETENSDMASDAGSRSTSGTTSADTSSGSSSSSTFSNSAHRENHMTRLFLRNTEEFRKHQSVIRRAKQARCETSS